MRALSLACLAASLIAFSPLLPRDAAAQTEPPRISGPIVHENLAVYFIHGPSAPGPVPLTLQEAMDKGTVQVIETGSVNQIKIENTGSEEVFIQSGDIVKGGQQDRVIQVSFVLPAKSGRCPSPRSASRAAAGGSAAPRRGISSPAPRTRCPHARPSWP